MARTKRERMPDAMMERVALQFRALGEASRLRLLEALLSGPKNVGELAAHAGLSHANASKHLAVLAAAGLLTRTKSGAAAVYATTDDTPSRLCDIMCGHVTAQVERDLAAAKRLLGR
jgi:DNA-binding transcriptional ArsR family regulator